jgi:crotonobetainyl-CoA:carnitine CoA-transferase CaiB-like acyl-CoA transferase
MLADFGAEVIKIEIPGRGDPLRYWGPPFLGGESVYFLSLNRNKKSMTLNLKAQKGREIFFKLVRMSDVLVENFSPGTMDRLGLGYETVRAVNPRIIYCSISGYGRSGPFRELGGYDLIAQGESGLMAVTGEPDRPPVKVGVAIADFGAGMYAAYGILLALIARERTGKGQMVDVALLDSAVSWMPVWIGLYSATGEQPKRLGTAHPLAAPYEAYKTRDIHITIGCSADEHWRGLCRLLGLEKLAEDPRFATNQKRVENREELTSILSAVFTTKGGEEWLKQLREAGIPCGPVNTLEKIVSNPQLLHRDMLIEMDHPTAGRIKIVGIPVKLSESPGKIKSPPPLVGEQTEEILRGLGYSGEDLRRLREEGTI